MDGGPHTTAGQKKCIKIKVGGGPKVATGKFKMLFHVQQPSTQDTTLCVRVHTYNIMNDAPSFFTIMCSGSGTDFSSIHTHAVYQSRNPEARGV